jgi:hypothetical protein
MKNALHRSAAKACVALTFALGAQAQTKLPCEASPEVKQALRDMRQKSGRLEIIYGYRALLERFPSDLFVHEAYQEAAVYPSAKEREAVIGEYRSLAEKFPGNPLYEYLSARAQIGVNTKQLIPRLETLGAGVPSAYLDLVRIYQSPNFKDPKKAQENLEAFMKVCPSSPHAFDYLRRMELSDFVRQRTVRLRSLLGESDDPDSLVGFGTLWALEFRVKPAAEHEALRKQVAEDLRRLRGIDPGTNNRYYSMMQEGYKLTGDEDGGKWAAEQIQRVAPRSAYLSAISRWNEANPRPKENDPPEKRTAYDEARMKATADWARQWPESSYVWFNRLNALRTVDQAAATDVEAAGENFLTAIAKSPGEFGFMSTEGGNSAALVVAYLYAKKGVGIDRLPALVEQGIAEIGKTFETTESDLYPRQEQATSQEFNRWYGWQTIADIWLKVKEKDRAREALDQLQGLMEKSKPKPGSKDAAEAEKQRTYFDHQVEYWSRMGDLAVLQSRKIDALTFYQNALLTRISPPGGAQKDELAEKTRALWGDLGGSSEGWQAWFNRRELLGQLPGLQAGSTWNKIEKRLPEFDLADLSGTKWRLASLKGKTTLIVTWATW